MKRQLLSLVAVVLMTGTASAASLRGGGAAATCGCICPDDACLAPYECSQAEHDAEMLRCNLPGGIPLEPGPVIPSGGKGARQLYTTFAADAVAASQPLAASQCKASPADITFCTDAFVAAGCPTNGVKAKAAGWPSAAVTARCGAVLDKTDSCHLFARCPARAMAQGAADTSSFNCYARPAALPLSAPSASSVARLKRAKAKPGHRRSAARYMASAFPRRLDLPLP